MAVGAGPAAPPPLPCFARAAKTGALWSEQPAAAPPAVAGQRRGWAEPRSGATGGTGRPAAHGEAQRRERAAARGGAETGAGRCGGGAVVARWWQPEQG